jgi:branched-chain amino acid transport system permease protein
MKHVIKMILLGLLAIFLIYPVVTGNAFMSVFLAQMMGKILLTVAAWALLEVGGQPVFSISALAGIGVYGYALLTTHADINPWLALLLGVLLATIVGLGISVPSIKVGGIMNQGILNIFFIFAFSALITAFSKFTGGDAGINVVKLTPVAFFSSIPNKYLIIMVLTVLGVGGIAAILRSRTGTTIALVAKNENLASTLGINAKKYKRLAYLLFVPFIALAGFCISFTTGFTTPVTWSTDLAFMAILAYWIGGSRSIYGPIIGSAIITSIPTLFNMAVEWRIVICGVLALLIRMYMHEGILGLLEKITAKVKGVKIADRLKVKKAG